MEQQTIRRAEKSQTASQQGTTKESQISHKAKTVLLNRNIAGNETDVATCILASEYKGYSSGSQLSNGVVEWE